MYLLGAPLRRRREKRARLAERRKRRAEKRAREQDEEGAAEDEEYRAFLDDVYEFFDTGRRVFPVEREDQDLGMRSVEEGLFDDEWRSGKLFLMRRQS